MAENPRDGKRSGRLLLPAVLLPVVCCGGLILLPLIGSTTLGAIGGYLGDPLIQLGGLSLLAVAGLAVWRRHRARRAR